MPVPLIASGTYRRPQAVQATREGREGTRVVVRQYGQVWSWVRVRA
jgi:hypothetical protein